MGSKRIHFHTFDALRFFSFFLVFLQHAPIDTTSFFVFFSKSGGIGVSFFFVLSGFLITYILITEKVSRGFISLKNFFVRRILRIWPLFFAMILFAFLTPYLLQFFKISFSNEGYTPNWWLSILFLENYNMMITNSFPNVSPLRVMWSLCVEEHFYIIWGISIFFLPLKKIPNLILVSIVIANIARLNYSYYSIAFLDVFSNLDYFAYGAIPAYILVMRNDVLSKVEVFPLVFRHLILVSTVLLIFIIPNFNWGYLALISPTIYGILFSSLILFTITQRNSIYLSDKLLISKLGIYTYSLYLFHTIIINLLLRIKFVFPFELHWVMLLFISLFTTILMSILSYHLFEKHFLKLKRYFY